MGMGYGSNYADTVEESFIKDQCANELANFNVEMQNWLESEDKEGNGRSEWELYELLEYEGKSILSDPSNENFEIVNTYDDLVSKFYIKTGLNLSLCYHNSDDNGDRYDDVNGFFWCVDGVYEYTKAGNKYRNDIKRVMYVTYG